MTKLIAVTGATGAQGGSVVRVLLETKGWKVRAITRNPNGDAAKALAAKGAEVVSANFDDEESVKKAFDGASAIFAVTTFWEHLFAGQTQAQAGEGELRQAMVLARAAAQTKSLEHYIWSSLPDAAAQTGGRFPVPHLDYKAQADRRIRAELPELAAKTTYLFVGFYPSNLAFFPMMKPVEVQPGTDGKYILALPTAPTALLGTSGDMNVTPGAWVRQILARPDKSRGRYALAVTETLSFQDIVKTWSEVTGKPAVFAETSAEGYEKLWGIPGKEIAMQFKWGEAISDWTYDLREQGLFVSKEELGITDEEARPLKSALDSLKALLV